MASIRDGGAVIRPSTGARVPWTPIEPVADEYQAAKALAGQGYSCLGVIGNAAHLRGSGGHTPWCSEGYAGRACRFGKVYAIDLTAPNMTGLEAWLIPRLRAGYYRWVYYLNINGHQYTRKDSFRGRYSSADHHLHLSGLAGRESDNSSILRDWETARSGPAQIPTQPTQEDELSAEFEKRASGQLDAMHDAVVGGKGSGYRGSVMRTDHGYQIDEIERRIVAHVDRRLDRIEAALARLAPPAA